MRRIHGFGHLTVNKSKGMEIEAGEVVVVINTVSPRAVLSTMGQPLFRFKLFRYKFIKIK